MQAKQKVGKFAHVGRVTCLVQALLHAPVTACTIMNVLSMFTTVHDDGGRRDHSKKLFKKRCRLDAGKYSFINRMLDKWNSLPDSCVNCTTVNIFKTHIAPQLEPDTQYCV